MGNPHAPPLWPELEEVLLNFPCHTWNSVGDAAEAQDRVASPREWMGDIIRPISKVVPFALGEERWDPGKDSRCKAKGRPGSQ